MSDLPTLRSLLSRVEGATGQDRRLADDILLACGWRHNGGDLDNCVYGEGERAATTLMACRSDVSRRSHAERVTGAVTYQ